MQSVSALQCLFTFRIFQGGLFPCERHEKASPDGQTIWKTQSPGLSSKAHPVPTHPEHRGRSAGSAALPGPAPRRFFLLCLLTGR